MGWTILRPVIFMDNLVPGFPRKILLTMLRDTMKDKPLQWVATKDLGFFAAQAFTTPALETERQWVWLATSSFAQLSQAFEKATGQPAGTTFSLLGKALKHDVSEMGIMVDLFRDDGYKASLPEIRELHPNVTTMETWLRECIRQTHVIGRPSVEGENCS
ncbi:hypothetical protein N657DRAFT_646258 [Parathielavia appendiculata]|uniref:NmrA-like domain-containing protein n=1 Tax=Parathielavia appendiculata TaxID=2587402 RepID=A0AAN6TXE7_9PEZI|nr:hypothetical protein N657DRAFT_646258 [Parathielavia appendiculata]